MCVVIMFNFLKGIEAMKQHPVYQHIPTCYQCNKIFLGAAHPSAAFYWWTLYYSFKSLMFSASIPLMHFCILIWTSVTWLTISRVCWHIQTWLWAPHIAGIKLSMTVSLCIVLKKMCKMFWFCVILTFLRFPVRRGMLTNWWRVEAEGAWWNTNPYRSMRSRSLCPLSPASMVAVGNATSVHKMTAPR